MVTYLHLYLMQNIQVYLNQKIYLFLFFVAAVLPTKYYCLLNLFGLKYYTEPKNS